MEADEDRATCYRPRDNRIAPASLAPRGWTLSAGPVYGFVRIAGRFQPDSVDAFTGMRSLPREQRQTIELAYFGGYSQLEISRMIDVPLGTIKSRTRLALEKLCSYLQGRGLIDAG